eukprot:Gb_18596 [translate_table: standard]
MNAVGASLAFSGTHLKDNSLSHPTFESAVGIETMGNTSIEGGKLLGMVAVFLIQRKRHALIGSAIDAQDTRLVLNFLSSNSVVDTIYDCKNTQRTGCEVWAEEAVKVWDCPTGRAKCTQGIQNNEGKKTINLPCLPPIEHAKICSN